MLEAQYQDGFVLREDEQDHSPYDSGKNIFHAIFNKRPEEVHGKMVRLSYLTPQKRYDIDWTKLPDNARPIRFIRKELDVSPVAGPGEVRTVGVDFGYQYTLNGENHQEVKEIR